MEERKIKNKTQQINRMVPHVHRLMIHNTLMVYRKKAIKIAPNQFFSFNFLLYYIGNFLLENCSNERTIHIANDRKMLPNER